MLVLALETATRGGSVALCVDGTFHAAAGDPDRTHGERLPGELLALLARHGQRLSSVELLAIIAGPGSFTGLRIGMAAIQGLAIAGGLKVVAVPTLEAMAQGRLWQAPPPQPMIIAACLDGQRGEIFGAAWRTSGTASIAESEELMAPQVVTATAFSEELRLIARGTPVMLVGDGARRYAAVFDRDVEIADVSMPLAEVAARHAARHPGEAVPPHALRPLYIRRPDAVLARERAGAPARAPRP
jgi:tRNA threonylcarbamoyladenosine biosynthesis protein TsaB